MFVIDQAESLRRTFLTKRYVLCTRCGRTLGERTITPRERVLYVRCGHCQSLLTRGNGDIPKRCRYAPDCREH